MNLCVDIGNTRTKAALFDRGELVRLFYTELSALWSDDRLLDKLKGIILSSTKSILSISDIPSRIHNKLVLDHTTPLPIEVLYETPDTLGKDRLAAAVGANHMYPEAFSIIIDAGTCITMDLVKKGRYMGGNISPGIKMRAKAMHDYTGLLPEVEIQYHVDYYGKNTTHALQNGASLGTIFEIDSFISSVRDNFPLDNINVILTGGDANFLAKHIKSKIFVKENIVLIGLHEILRHNEH